jgi:hypothetical protein
MIPAAYITARRACPYDYVFQRTEAKSSPEQIIADLLMF